MPLSVGDKLGPYEILAPIGAGGMGEVYRAHDSRLKREVALKALPATLADDPARLARFQREAEVLASLNHPNIAQIHGFEDAGSVRAIVMELVEGETLAGIIKRGPIPLETAVGYAKQIASALEYAHDKAKAVIHRDLKPANVQVTPDGVVKVLDFGLAKALADEPQRSAAVENSPTLTMGPTVVGMILGTAAYMSPEQAQGKPLDRRTDIWSFGVLLYEMVTGKRLFTGEETAEILAAIVLTEPSLKGVPARVRPVIERCLRKDPRKRWYSMEDARFALDEEPAPEAAGSAPSRSWFSSAGWIAAGVLGLAAAAASLVHFREPRPVGQPLIRALLPGIGSPNYFALSPDGSRLAYMEGSKLFLRNLDRSTSTELATGAASGSPFFSPDGKWIGFFATDGMKKISVEGGSAVPLTSASNGAAGGSWGEDGNIVAVPIVLQPLSIISEAGGGTPKHLLELDAGESNQSWPSILPGGRAVLYTSTVGEGAEVRAFTFSSHKVKTLVKAGSRAVYFASGHLAYVDRGSLFVVPFDVNTLETHGTPVPLLSGVFTSNSNGFSVSRNGILAVRLGDSGSGASTIQLIDNHSVLKPLLAAGTYMRPRFSPDGKSLALDLDSSFVGVYDLDRETLRRLTRAGVTRGPQPVWTPDGRFLIFGGDGELSWIRSDGASAPQRLIQSKNIVWPQSVSPDGKFLLYLELTDDLHGMIAPLEISTEGLRAGKSERVLQAAGADRQFMFSPDGKWIAFASNQSGTYQVYVRAFPDRGAQWQVSNQGGVYPMWSRTANEMLYRSEDSRTLMAVSYTVKGDAFVPDKPYLWASTQMVDTPLTANFDLAPDGKHVAGVFPVTGGENAEPLMLLVNFFDEVTRRAPLGK